MRHRYLTPAGQLLPAAPGQEGNGATASTVDPKPAALHAAGFTPSSDEFYGRRYSTNSSHTQPCRFQNVAFFMVTVSNLLNGRSALP